MVPEKLDIHRPKQTKQNKDIFTFTPYTQELTQNGSWT